MNEKHVSSATGSYKHLLLLVYRFWSRREKKQIGFWKNTRQEIKIEKKQTCNGWVSHFIKKPCLTAYMLRSRSCVHAHAQRQERGSFLKLLNAATLNGSLTCAQFLDGVNWNKTVFAFIRLCGRWPGSPKNGGVSAENVLSNKAEHTCTIL